MQQRSRYRRRRRSANLRYRQPRFLNRRKPRWLPPSLRSRIGNVLRLCTSLSPMGSVSQIEVEQVKFDLALMQNSEVAGIEYQRGELSGWEVRAYLLEKFHRRCVYCGKGDTAFEIDHQVPRSRGGSDRVSNLVLSCHDCNSAKGNRTAAECGYPDVATQAKQPLRDAAAVNATRLALVEALSKEGLPLGSMEWWTHTLEPITLRNLEDSCARCLMRWKSCRSGCWTTAHARNCCPRARTVSAHARRWVWFSPWVFDATEKGTRFLNGRSGTSSGPSASQDAGNS